MIKILSSSESSSNLLTFIKKVKKSDKKLFKMKCTKVPGTLARTYACAYLISTCGIRRACHFSQNG